MVIDKYIDIDSMTPTFDRAGKLMIKRGFEKRRRCYKATGADI